MEAYAAPSRRHTYFALINPPGSSHSQNSTSSRGSGDNVGLENSEVCGIFTDQDSLQQYLMPYGGGTVCRTYDTFYEAKDFMSQHGISQFFCAFSNSSSPAALAPAAPAAPAAPPRVTIRKASIIGIVRANSIRSLGSGFDQHVPDTVIERVMSNDTENHFMYDLQKTVSRSFCTD